MFATFHLNCCWGIQKFTEINSISVVFFFHSQYIFESVFLRILMSRGWLILTCTVKVNILVFHMTHLLFSLFWLIPCIFARNLIKFNAKLTLIKDRSFPPPQNPPLVQEQLIWSIMWSWPDLDLIWCFEWQFWLNGSAAWFLFDCYTTCTHFFCIYSCPVLAWCKVEYLVLTIVLKHAEVLICFSAWFHTPIYGSPFNISPVIW